MADVAKTNTPLPAARLKQICNDACVSALEKSDTYVHSMTEQWNNAIINHILRSLISETTPESASGSGIQAQTPYKFAVNSTIMQHPTNKVKSEDAGDDVASSAGRRGMHSACGGYWNTEKDGMYAFKHDAKGMDVVVSIIWIATA